MFKVFTLTLLLTLIPIAKAKRPAPKPFIPIYRLIVRNKPQIKHKYALKLAKVIYKASKAYKIKPKLVTAILAQESSYNLKVVNKKSRDFGISQINYKTAKRYHFNIHKLTTNLKYSVKAGVIILHHLKQLYSTKEKYWWTRYNASNKYKRYKYRKLVMRYM
jgi:soluble lytic murein transglycosylase-like protein